MSLITSFLNLSHAHTIFNIILFLETRVLSEMMSNNVMLSVKSYRLIDFSRCIVSNLLLRVNAALNMSPNAISSALMTDRATRRAFYNLRNRNDISVFIAFENDIAQL